jgi:hypothetical protein
MVLPLVCLVLIPLLRRKLEGSVITVATHRFDRVLKIQTVQSVRVCQVILQLKRKPALFDDNSMLTQPLCSTDDQTSSLTQTFPVGHHRGATISRSSSKTPLPTSWWDDGSDDDSIATDLTADTPSLVASKKPFFNSFRRQFFLHAPHPVCQ